ncbi:cold-regulated 413 inner membrane protein 1, chloroplastic-like isoform X2 [Miscanthus floridulus]|uniref:cold-regulated 413 inner membrane protein 1, chloroplastic-like isoform X2 n=1 Tax=Miscanthus floridulus TaxID=154761 RepID=UPI00345A0DC8
MAAAMRFFVLRGASARKPPCPGARSRRCWRLASVALCCASAQQCTDALRWICITAAARLMLAAGTTVDKSLLVPFVALQAPSGVTFWARQDHGRWMWIAVLVGPLMRFLYMTTGEWRRAISTTFLVAICIVLSQVMNLRESQGRAILTSAIAVYLAFQHFTGAGSLRKAFSGVAIFATLCIVCMTTISLMLLF